MSSIGTNGRPPTARLRKRLKVDLACDVCRTRKVKCDGGRPACENCAKRPALLKQCVYALGSSEHVTDSPSATIPNAVLERPSDPGCVTENTRQDDSSLLESFVVGSNRTPSSQPTPSQGAPLLAGSQTHGGSSASHEHFGDGSSSAFTGQIKAAIDARSGGAVHLQSPTIAPMVDVSLFPSLQDPIATDSLADRMEYELPPRRKADHLVNAYWSLVDPLFPVLSKSQFMHSYNALFAGTAIDSNERILVSTLNAMLALSSQVQESLDPRERERSSGKYFQRAHGLLQLPVWETGSIELIQCLLLMSQYLQCTNKPHQTWMVVGSAVRIAQGLGLHLPEIWASFSCDVGIALKRRVWQLCIIMDRVICIAHGRPAMVSANIASIAIDTYSHTQPGEENQLPYNDFVARALELYEITHHATQKCFPLPHSHGSNANCFHILDPSPAEEQLALALQIDGCLNRWRHSLPAHLEHGSSEHPRDEISARQATILHLRFLHSRILLFRPILARCCLATESIARSSDSLCGSLCEHLMERCASECVTAAKDMISNVRQHQMHDFSILPAWWYRMFYTYTAAMVLAVSTLRTDLFPRSQTHAIREDALMLFQAHEHLSESVRVCKTALQRLSSRIEHMQNISGSALRDDNQRPGQQDVTTTEYQDIFQDFIFNLDHDSFVGLDSMSWLTDEQFPGRK